MYYFYFEVISWGKLRSEFRISGVVEYIFYVDYCNSNDKEINVNKLY